MDTGFSDSDAQSDFSRARRRQLTSALARRLRREPDDVNQILPFDEVVAALGRRGERRLGLQTIELDSIVGTVDRTPRVRPRASGPTSRRVRSRWQRIAKAHAARRGDAADRRLPDRRAALRRATATIASRSRAQLGLEVIEAYVTEIVTEVGADARRRRSHDLAAEEPRAPVLRARAAARRASARRIVLPRPSSGTPSSPRASRPGASALMQARGEFMIAARGRRGVVPATSSSRSSRCCARPT